jgi:proteasome lid subunit RPN8/RPN11
MLMAMREARNCSLEIIGIYHSHPDHPAVPSECDRQLAWPQYSYIIVSVAQGYAAESKSWILDDTHQFQPEPIVIAAIADPHASSPPGHTTYTQPNVINERNHAQP